MEPLRGTETAALPFDDTSSTEESGAQVTANAGKSELVEIAANPQVGVRGNVNAAV